MYSSVDTIWVLLGAALVFFMQAGFAMVETGLTRAKNAGNIIMKNLMDFALGTVAFWLAGFGIMFAGDGALIGGFDPFILGDYSSTFPSWAFVIFQTVFCATAATIVSGAMAERTKFLSYCIYSVAISLIVYPVGGHWVWGGGWLSQLGFHDFAGSTAVHMVGGLCALIGAKMVGPRIGKYTKDGKANAIPGHSLTLAALGCFILWFCWFGFNGCSTVSMTGDETLVNASLIFVNTNLAAAVATCVVMIITWSRYKKPDVSMTLNGSLAGLVAITAGCDAVDPFGAAIIGLIAGFAVVFGVEFIDQKLKIDDPVGAIGVHFVNGALGTVLTGLFATDGGLFYGGGFGFLGVQILDVLAVCAWVGVAITLVFFLLKKTIGLRVSREEEIDGLDIHEHGLISAYADFAPMSLGMVSPEVQETVEGAVPAKSADEAVPVVETTTVTAAPASGPRISKVVILLPQSRFDALKEALSSIGVTGLTVTQVLGCGVQKGQSEFYRGVPMDVTLLPKVKVEVVVSRVPVRSVIDVTKRVLYTGHIGDGKIFVYNVENVVKVRTGEEGVAALQDTH